MNLEKHVWEGWTVQDFIDDIEPIFDLIMTNRGYLMPFTDTEQVKEWCKNNQPYYKKHIPEVYNYFKIKFKEYERKNKNSRS